MISYIRGYYVVTIEGINTEKFLNTLIRNKVNVYDVKRISNTKIELKVDRKSIRALKSIYRGSKFEVKIKQKTGLPFLARRIYRYKGMWICAMLSLVLLMSTSLFVTDVYIKAPEGIDKVLVRKELEKAGVRPGVYKKGIDRKEVRDQIMGEFGDIAYVSINVKGTNIFVTITKKDESLQEKKETNYCNIIAKKNGIIEKVIPRSGKQVANVGDIVRKGDVLVSGSNTKSLPEVWATTFYESKQSTNYIDKVKTRTGNKKTVYTFSFYDKKYTLRRNIDFKNYEIENKEHVLTIGDYTFPLKIKSSIFHEVNVKEVEKNKEEVKEDLKQKALKELEYTIPVDSRYKDVKHQYKVKKDKLEYIVTVTTLENIVKVHSLSKSEAEELIRQESKPKEGEEEVPSNPDKRPINDIRNEFKDINKDKDAKDKEEVQTRDN
ncbi:sporulation protein YqfD [Paraclostridium bifermentans]|uniref:sporulation protein YqfD n=1 Tax=Paraclostridium bifermentans TaxID=1490 RepID=UPI002906073F|nr:sporulation protein YqfD [Paraclostridium bifermentans]MDU3336024.1 sporulation protein YqfD [Paraclostridium bifermentans]